MKADFGGSVTVYAGAIYEKTTSGSSTTITKYYQAGGQRVAMRVNGVVRWLATDHLGSTSITANEAGARMAAPTPPTEFPLSAGAAGSLVTPHRRGRRRRMKITSGQLADG